MDVEGDLAKAVGWWVDRAGLAFQYAVSDQFRVLLLLETAQIFWVGEHFGYLPGGR